MTGASVDDGNEAQPGVVTRLMDDLIPLGASLPESHKPSPATVPQLLAGLLYWLETGSMEAPKVETTQPQITTSKDAMIAELKAQLQAAQTAAENAAHPVGPSPVAPAPISPPIAASPVAPAATETQPGASSTEPPAAVPVPPVSDVPSAPAS